LKGVIAVKIVEFGLLNGGVWFDKLTILGKMGKVGGEKF